MRKPFDGEYPLTQAFGVNPDIYARFQVKQPDGTLGPMRGHNGLDFKVPTGTVMKAPFAGKVIEATFDRDGYGNYIKIEDGKQGVVMAHMERILVGVGAMVNEGEAVAVSDNTGYSTGPHLHLGYYKLPRDRGDGFGGFIDPTPYFDNMPIPPATGPLHTDEEYRVCMADREKFWKERDDLSKANQTLTEELTALKAQLSTFEALGYKTVDDIASALKKKDDMVEGLTKQNVQVLKRNADLADALKAKETEDYTAIEEGLKAARENDTLKEQIKRAKEASGLKRTIDTEQFLYHLTHINGVIKSYLAAKELKKKEEKTVEEAPDLPPVWKALGLSVIFLMVFEAIIVYI